MDWQSFTLQWSVDALKRLGIERSTIFAWRNGTRKPKKGWPTEAATLFIETKAGEKEKPQEKPGKPEK